MTREFLPYGRQTVTEADIKAVQEVLTSDFLTTGPMVDQFEAALAARLNASHAVACNSGTSALHLALMAAGIGPGDAVIVPSLTFVATANMARLTGAEVILADVDPVSGLMTLDHVRTALERATCPVKAIMPVLLNGYPGDFNSLIDFAMSENIWLICDGCHAIGSDYQTPSGPLLVGGDRAYDKLLTTFSFHPVKTITMGEGGAVLCQNQNLAAAMRSLRHHGIKRSAFSGSLTDDYQAPWYHEFHQIAYNYRASDIACALGLSQLKRLDRIIQKRRALVDAYIDGFSSLDLVTPVAKGCTGLISWHLMAVHINYNELAIDKSAFIECLRDQYQIGTQVHYIPLHRQPLYADRCQGDLSGADHYYQSILSLPLYESITDDDVDYVVKSVQKICMANH